MNFPKKKGEFLGLCFFGIYWMPFPSQKCQQGSLEALYQGRIGFWSTYIVEILWRNLNVLKLSRMRAINTSNLKLGLFNFTHSFLLQEFRTRLDNKKLKKRSVHVFLLPIWTISVGFCILWTKRCRPNQYRPNQYRLREVHSKIYIYHTFRATLSGLVWNSGQIVGLD